MKTGKATIYASDYANAIELAKRLGIEVISKSQIGVEVNVEIKYKDLTHVGKWFYNMALVHAQKIQPQQNAEKPQTTGAGAKPVKKT